MNQEHLHETTISHDRWPTGGFHHHHHPLTPRGASRPLSPALRARAHERQALHDPDALVENSGTSFLVAAFGEVNWVRNLRAAGSAQLTRRRRTEAIGVVELGAREAAPILKQFLRESQSVSFIKPYFHVTPQSSLADFEQEALYHPVFRIVNTNGREVESVSHR